MSRFPCLAVAVSLAAGLSACGKSNEPGSGANKRFANLEAYKASPEFTKLSAEEQRRTLEAFKQSLEERPALDAERAKERAELVRPPTPGWRAEAPGRHLKLNLIPQKTRYRVGDRFWYMLELKNVGSESVRVFEGDSFFKFGDRDMHHWKVIVDGREVGRRALPLFAPPITEPFNPPGFDRMTDQEKDEYVLRLNREASAQQWRTRTLLVTLAPGEALHTRPWRFVDSIDAQRRREQGLSPADPAKGRFRELGPYRFERTGPHIIQVSYRADIKRPPAEEFIEDMKARGYTRDDVLRMQARGSRDRLESMESNVVEISVGP